MHFKPSIEPPSHSQKILNSRAIIAESSPLHITSASARAENFNKSLTTKLCTLLQLLHIYCLKKLFSNSH